MDPSLLDLLSKGGAIGVLAFVVVGFYRGWIVPGYLYRSQKRERDQFLELLLQGTRDAEKAVRVAKDAVEG